MRWWHTGDVDPDRPIAKKDVAPEDRFRRFIGEANEQGCTPWLGTVNRTGYGYFSRGGRPTLAHRFAYEQQFGSVPEGQQLDHTCHTQDKSCRGGVTCPHRRCVNPAHLEPVTGKENNNRGRAAELAHERRESAESCPSGHPFTPENTGRSSRGYRYCQECNRQHGRARSLKSQGLRDPRRTPDDKVEAVRAMLRDGVKATTIAATVGVSYGTVKRIKHGGSWFVELP